MNDEIVRKAQKGDDEAFGQLIMHYKNDLYAVAFRYFHNEIDALEAIQETTYRAYKSIKKLKDTSVVKPWLIRILANYCLNEIRKRKRLVHSDWLLDQEEEVPIDWNDRLNLQENIFQLKRDLQQVILLKYYQGYTIKEVSNILDKPESTIKTWLYKALKQMRHNMEKEGVTDGK
ncbi:sigma-70 family RNA polymerase sigma factor [Pseudalkalibacillus berkeleyi]|uniref:RNA polymerase sigma factor n=1 Tax=Pseudalkalibacillus berkeleyi TaxID=1069813 RepID=A0ABS9H427_9BACL|nr:sigma-70 family RNA polymerase sigma factor [Pseudalkalibacillus berkeleyi]MCF6138415.1 RNA polymerase sigma factor [Pseudalkalibacillus berkeleyi]